MRLLAWIVMIFSMWGSPTAARDHVEVAGSSTVFPFTAAVIEHVVRVAGVSVVTNSTGTGGGIRAFCRGLGDDTPDVTAASRRMTEDERERCEAHGVTGITEIPIGYDGIVDGERRPLRACGLQPGSVVPGPRP
jgi:phosphate transport system substrate-binding protein